MLNVTPPVSTPPAPTQPQPTGRVLVPVGVEAAHARAQVRVVHILGGAIRVPLVHACRQRTSTISSCVLTPHLGGASEAQPTGSRLQAEKRDNQQLCARADTTLGGRIRGPPVHRLQGPDWRWAGRLPPGLIEPAGNCGSHSTTADAVTVTQQQQQTLSLSLNNNSRRCHCHSTTTADTDCYKASPLSMASTASKNER